MLKAGNTRLMLQNPNSGTGVGFFVDPVRSVGTGTANLGYNTSSAEIIVVSSSRRYKTDIADVQPSESGRVWDLRPVSYRGIEEGEGASKVYGFIAEEVEAVEPRLCFYGQDEQSGQPRVEGVNYDMVVPLLLQEMKALRARIDVLEQQLAAK